MVKQSFKFQPKGWFTPNSYGNNFSELPESSGVYLFVATELFPSITHRVLYVGMSQNILKRIGGYHEVLYLCKEKYDYVQIYFKRYIKNLRKRERCFIHSFNPSYNLQHRTRGT